jgi:tripeptide aminopeptidase
MMINAISIALELERMLPEWETPEHTEGYEGFYHLEKINGKVESADMSYIIRDHDMAIFEARKSRILKIVDYLNDKYGKGTIELELADQYYNMKQKIEQEIHIVETAKKAMEEADIIPLIRPIRGGTDGATLSFMGLPTPNIFTGGHNFHSRYEFIPIPSMEKAVEVILRIVDKYSRK